MPSIISPVDGSVYSTVPYLTREHAVAKIEAAQRAQKELRRLSLQERIALCRRALHAFSEEIESHALALTKMTGKPLSQARAEFESGVRERTEFLFDVAEEALAPVVLEDVHASPGVRIRRFIRREPLGVVLDIAAWNYPWLIVTNILFPALLAGNAVLIKHAEQTAPVADQWADAFARAGAPEGAVQAFFPDHQTIAELLDQRRFDGLSFTGSVRGGHEVAQAVGRENFLPVGFELGGKDAAYVCADADIPFAAENLADAAFYNAGQSCCGVERIYLHQEVREPFLREFEKHLRALRLGSPLEQSTSLGPLIHGRARQHALEQVEGALKGGGFDLVSPAEFQVPGLSDCYMAPRALVDVAQDSDLMQTESFAPVVGIRSVDDDAEALSKMNDSRYGLTASIWSNDYEKALGLGEKLQVGTVFQNRADYLDPALPWSGRKDSGVGLSLSRFGFHHLTRTKSYHMRETRGVVEGEENG
ncbi:MAG: aldehyde dehydrogenase family protein [Polyangiaceae bacterium]|nr:aldehyde dehydrogenase family protein [Polyangiaceae bacterium]